MWIFLPILFIVACQATLPPGPTKALCYAGSSTVGTFMVAADQVYFEARITLDTSGESDGGEQAILESACHLAGVAREPSPGLIQAGVRATLIGRDALAIIVHPSCGVDVLSLTDAGRVFRGEIENWTELGGADLEVQGFVVAKGSATRGLLRQQLLGGDDLVDCEEVLPDAALVERVAGTPGGVGAISFAFQQGHRGVRAVALDGQRPGVTNFDYPLARPLHLLWRPEDSSARKFVEWALSPAGQRIVMQHFVGTGVRGSVGAEDLPRAQGQLLVTTETREVLDGGTLYYPHRSYTLLTRHGKFLRRVRNYRGLNDEQPTRVSLEPGIYLVRTETSAEGTVEFFATVTTGRTTVLDVLKRLGEGN